MTSTTNSVKCFLTKIVYAFITSPMHVAWPEPVVCGAELVVVMVKKKNKRQLTQIDSPITRKYVSTCSLTLFYITWRARDVTREVVCCYVSWNYFHCSDPFADDVPCSWERWCHSVPLLPRWIPIEQTQSLLLLPRMAVYEHRLDQPGRTHWLSTDRHSSPIDFTYKRYT